MGRTSAVTIFSFGYWGWGNSTPQLVELFDALEQSRGFKPPLLVDIRIARSVRAPGFNNRALEKLVGADRYLHIPELGNRAVIENTGELITIANPDAARNLLDLALSEHRANRRIVFFCACQYQMEERNPSCHRYEVGSLLLSESLRRNQTNVVTEWPGTEPEVLRLSLPSEILKKLRVGSKSVPLPREMMPDQIAAIAWGSVAYCSGDGEFFSARVDRAKWSTSGWYLPVLDRVDENAGVASNGELFARGFSERRAGG